MIYKKCIMTINKNNATLDEDIYLFRLDKNIELHFSIVNNRYKFDKSDLNNIIAQTNAAYFQIRLYRSDEIKYTFAIQPTQDGVAVLTITDDLINDPIELGEYDFQISLLDADKTSMISMPIVKQQLHVCEPLVDNQAIMGRAVLGLSSLASGEIKNAFDSEGNYIREIHNDGDILSAQLVNKFEEALDTNTKAIKSQDSNLPHTISSKVLVTVPASDIKLNDNITVNNVSINKDRRYYIEFLGSKKLCSLSINEEIGNCIVCSIGNYNIQAFKNSTNIMLLIELGKNDITTDTFTDLVIYEEEVKYLDNKYLETDLTLQNSISLGRVGKIGAGSSAIGVNVIASGDSSHSEGEATTALGNSSHAEGMNTTASGDYGSHAEGSDTIASGVASHAEGSSTTASNYYSHAEGDSTTASGENSHSEGKYTTASGESSHAEGDSTTASAYCSHAEGNCTTASGENSHAEGASTIASSQNQHVQGKYNIEDLNGTYAHIVGNGEDGKNSNAHTLDWQGNAWYSGKLSQEGTPTEDKDLVTKKYVDDNKEYINYNDKLINDKITTLHISRNPVSCSTEINKKPLCELFPELLNMTYDTVFKKSISFKVNMDNFVKEYPTVKSAYNKIGINLYDENDNFIGNSYGSYINGDGLNIVYINTTQNIRFSAYFDKALVEGSNTSMETKNGYMTIQFSIPKGGNKKEFIDKIKNLKLSIIVCKTDFLNLNNESIYTPTSDYNPATKKYVDDKVTVKILPVDYNKNCATNVADLEPHSIYMPPNDAKFLYLGYEKLDGSFSGLFLSGNPHGKFIYTGTKDDTKIEVILEGICYTAYFKTDTVEPHTEKTVFYLTKNNTTEFTPTTDYEPATKKYVDDNILLEQLPILRIDETNKRIYVNCNNMGTYKKYFIPNKYANVYGFSFIYTNEDSSETEIALVGGAVTRDDFILCTRNTDTSFILILGGTNRYTYTKSTKTLEKGLYGYLKIGNTQEYAPTKNYNPATKKYVDDKVASLPQLSFNEAGELVVTINGVSKTFVPKAE